MSKLTDIIKIGATVGSAVAPGTVGSILSAVTKSIDDKKDPQNLGALNALAKRVDELEQAVVVLHERLKAVEGR